MASASSLSAGLFGADAEPIFARTKQLLILACGTSYHSGLVAKYWIESIARVPVAVEIASEYRYRDSVELADTLVPYRSTAFFAAAATSASPDMPR